MRGNLVHAVKDEVVLHDHEPEGVSPIPGIVLDDAMGVHLNPEVEHNQGPAKHPAEDVCQDALVGWEVEVGPRKERVGGKVAAVSLMPSHNPLAEDNVDQLTEDEPGVVLLGHGLPGVSLAHFHLEFAFPPASPSLAILAT